MRQNVRFAWSQSPISRFKICQKIRGSIRPTVGDLLLSIRYVPCCSPAGQKHILTHFLSTQPICTTYGQLQDKDTRLCNKRTLIERRRRVPGVFCILKKYYYQDFPNMSDRNKLNPIMTGGELPDTK